MGILIECSEMNDINQQTKNEYIKLSLNGVKKKSFTGCLGCRQSENIMLEEILFKEKSQSHFIPFFSRERHIPQLCVHKYVELVHSE